MFPFLVSDYHTNAARTTSPRAGRVVRPRPLRRLLDVMSRSQSISVEARQVPEASPRARLVAARAELSAATERGEGGRLALKQYSYRVDAMVEQVFNGAPNPSASVGVWALGGYGRRELCLHSDIDLLVLFAGEIGLPDEQFLQRFLNPLWDLGLTVGHHVREIGENFEIDGDNAEFLLALTDARPIVGDASLLERFLEKTDAAETATRTLEQLRVLIAARHARFNGTLFHVEPDLKEAPGGLRDLFGAMTIAKLTDPTLLSHGGAGRQALADAEDFLLRVRSTLHLQVGRQHDVLSHELQERVADNLRYPGLTPRQRVERLMSDYFRHARAVDRSLRWALRAAPVPVGPNLVQGGEGVRFIDVRRAADRPDTWLAAFQAAIDSESAVSDETLTWLQQNVDRFGAEDFFPQPRHREDLLRFLRPRPGLYARLSEMHDVGLLGRMFPEFEAVNCRVVRDFYHKYTVDEHTLLTIRNLEQLKTPVPERQRFAGLLSELERPELLVLALLFHDVGKWRDDDHVDESVRMVRRMFGRLDLDPDTRATVEFLVERHLHMSHVAFRRDTEDPEIVRQFATLVGVEERLKMLCLMTLADVEAVGRDTLTPWKEELIWRLYVDTYNHLTHAYGDDVIDRSESALAEVIDGRPADLDAAEIEAFVEGLPRRYVQLFTDDAVYQHVRHVRDLQSGVAQAWLERKGVEWELTVLTRDQPFLFSSISGVLSSFGMDILRGYAFTKNDAIVVDMFHFIDQERFLELNEGGDAKLLSVLEGVIAGRIDLAERLRRREEGAFRPRVPGAPPVIRCDNESSRRYSIVEIFADNELGLLYRMSRAMSDFGCDVDLVLIATEGRRAVDVFHLTINGAKLAAPQYSELIANLHGVLEGRP